MNEVGGYRPEVGGYRLLEQIGAGGMSRVFKAVGPSGQPVALKLLHPAFGSQEKNRARLRREVAMLQRVSGPYVAKIVDAEFDDPEVFIVTELVDGPTLSDDVAESGPYVGADLQELAVALGAALKSIHQVGVLHRDLKPSNVMMGPDGPVLIDFGISQLGDDLRLTQTGMLAHTPGFVDPRILEGASPDEEADWWALAAVLAFAATGRPPFGSGGAPAIMRRVLAGEADLAGLHPDLAAAFAAALRPRNRISYEELVAALGGQGVAGEAVGGTAAAGPGPERAETEVLAAGEAPTQALPAGEAPTQVTAPGEAPTQALLPREAPTQAVPEPVAPTWIAPVPTFAAGGGPADLPQFATPSVPADLPQSPAPASLAAADPAALPTRPSGARLQVFLAGLALWVFGSRWPEAACVIWLLTLTLLSTVGLVRQGLIARRIERGGVVRGERAGAILRLPFTLVRALLRSALSVVIGLVAGAAVVALNHHQPFTSEPTGAAAAYALALVVAWFIRSNAPARLGARLTMRAVAPTFGYRLFWLAIGVVVVIFGLVLAGAPWETAVLPRALGVLAWN